VTLTFSLLKCADSKSPYTVFQNGDLASAHFRAEKNQGHRKVKELNVGDKVACANFIYYYCYHSHQRSHHNSVNDSQQLRC